MMSPAATALRVRDTAPLDSGFEADVLAGLSRTPKRLPSKYFYDARGSELFERICEQPEYYLTRVELDIMQACGDEMAEALGPELRLVEFGSGAGLKTRLLLAALHSPVAYLPVEISPSALASSVAQLAEAFPRIDMQPVCADFTAPLVLPPARRTLRRTAVYFPGSTLGNFDGEEARALLRSMRALIGSDGAVLIGLDLKKDRAALEAAYNDAAGVTAAFTLNLLQRINRELAADFDLTGFRHRATYNTLAGRIETAIVSRVAQVVQVAGRRFEFAADEAIAVEISCKYAESDVQRLAGLAGLRVVQRWNDAETRFGVFLLQP
jgi:L-histidine Nalpha-methyltransferase